MARRKCPKWLTPKHMLKPSSVQSRMLGMPAQRERKRSKNNEMVRQETGDYKILLFFFGSIQCSYNTDVYDNVCWEASVVLK